MPTTKPPRDRDKSQDRTTPTYDRDKERRSAYHRDIDAIIDAEEAAQLDKRSIGFPGGRSDTVGGEAGWWIDNDDGSKDFVAATSVELASQRQESAIGWLAERTEALAQLTRVANMARKHWPPTPKKGQQTGGVTVGERGNGTEMCGLCNGVVSGGRTDPIRRIDGQAFHGKSCWFTVSRQRKP